MRTELFAIWFGPRAFSVAWYSDARWFGAAACGVRRLGPGRVALDLGKISFRFENYGR